MLIPIIKNKNNGFTVARVHYSLDPDKNNDAFIAEAKKGMSENGFRREYEIDYSLFSGKVFFPEFNEYNIAKEEIKYKTYEYIYRGWDYGFHRPLCIITKLNEFDQWCIIKCILGHDEGIREFGLRVKQYCTSHYGGAKYIDADDIAGQQVSDKSHQSSRQILNALGIFPQSRRQEIEQGVQIIRQKLPMRVDGKPGILVNPSETDVIDGFKGGIHYPEMREGTEAREIYEKDGYYDHIFDGMRYIAVEMFTIIGQMQEENDLTRDSLEYAYRDGRPRTSSNTMDVTMEDDGINDLLGGDLTGELS